MEGLRGGFYLHIDSSSPAKATPADAEALKWGKRILFGMSCLAACMVVWGVAMVITSPNKSVNSAKKSAIITNTPPSGWYVSSPVNGIF